MAVRLGWWLGALLVAAPLTGVCAKEYLEGVVIAMQATSEGASSVYDIQIQYQNHIYTAHLIESPAIPLQWPVERPVDFRIDKETIYLKRPSGKEAKAQLTSDAITHHPQPRTDQAALTAAYMAELKARCEGIAARGSEFKPLASACRYALSRESLPNLDCQEVTDRWVDGKMSDELTAEVKFIRGRDEYSNMTVNGKHVNSWDDVNGWISNALFGSELNAIFLPDTNAAFTVKDAEDTETGRVIEYEFHFDRSGSYEWGPTPARPGISGSIWVDEKSGYLRRVVAIATAIDPKRLLLSYKSDLRYGDLPVAELGDTLMPVSAEVGACMKPGSCYRNVLTFHGCQRFGSEIRIVPENVAK